MRIDILTLFPAMFQGPLTESIIKRAQEEKLLEVHFHDLRQFGLGSYHQVDDTPYGGGAGMVLKPEPMFACLEAIERAAGTPVIIPGPQGKPFQQEDADKLAACKEIILVCGHFEGFDERIYTLATQEISLGDFVITGGELAALVIIDAVGRLVPGVLGASDSLHQESFNEGNGGLLEGPQYTKPAEFRGMSVPAVLLSGDHKKIIKWRREQALKRTYERRPDLLERAELSKSDKEFLSNLEKSI